MASQGIYPSKALGGVGWHEQAHLPLQGAGGRGVARAGLWAPGALWEYVLDHAGPGQQRLWAPGALPLRKGTRIRCNLNNGSAYSVTVTFTSSARHVHRMILSMLPVTL